IQESAGYGGMIHNFKNYVRRGRDEYHEKANANITKLRTAIESYRSFDLNRGEKVALEDVLHMLDSYGAALDTIKTMLADGAGPKDIDAEVKVDDLPALRALNLLAHEANLEILDRSRAVDVSLQKIESAEQAVTIIEITFILIMAVLLTWLLRRQIIAPLKLISVNMKRIAVGDYDVSIADPSGNNEIAEMTRDLQVLLQNSISRYEAEQSLGDFNEKLHHQLMEVQNLREQADEQAASAVGMAETLAVATEEAELAKSKAEADEQRTRAIMNTVVDAIITVNSKGIIETFNMGAQTIFGYAPEEMIGRNVSFLMPEPLRSQHDGFIKSFMGGKPAGVVGRTIEQVGQRKSGEHFPIDLSINP
ncbi:MAG: PAS domain S-box protein, partial [Sphingomonadales bacterium]|nr:PAS domain S-box protein [Sphingomonadales bacterium]